VRSLGTTRCCSAVALVGFACAAIGAAPPASAPLPLFPVQPLWSLALNNQMPAPPAFDGAIGYFPLDRGRIVAYDLLQGKQEWIIDAPTRLEPAAGDGLLFLVEDGQLTARSSVDGAVAWQVPFDAELAVPAVWDNGWLIAATTKGEISAFRSADGSVVWRQTIGGQAHARPALAAGRVYIPTDDGHIVALRIDDGAKVWDRTVNGAVNDVLALDERLYFGSNDNHLYCVLTKDGSIDWKWPTGGDVVGLPAYDEHNVYFVSFDNVLRALDLKSGGQRWKTTVPFRPTRGPLRAADVLIVTGLSSKVAAYATKDGKTAGDVPAGGDVAAAPHLVGAGHAATPLLILVTSDIAKGATVVALSRSIEPPIVPIAPLPNITAVPLPKS
jgi:outer membrane protein assembly factor BamB